MTLLILARALGPASFGSISIGYAVGFVGIAMLSAGAQYRVLRAAATEMPVELAAGLFNFMIGISTLTVVIFSGLFLNSAIRSDLLVGIVVGVTDQLNVFSQNMYGGAHQHTRASIATLAPRAAVCLTVVTTGLSRVDTTTGYVTSSALVAVIVALWARTGYLRGTRGRFSLKGQSGYIYLAATSNLSQLEPLILGVFASRVTTGYYAAASRISGPLSLVAASLSSIIIPELSQRGGSQEARRLARRFTWITLAYFAVLTVTAYPLAELVVALIGHQFDGAKALIVGVIVASGLSAIGQSVAATLLAEGKPGRLSLSLGLASVTSLVGLAVLSRVDNGSLLWASPIAAQLMFLGSSWAIPRFRSR